MIVEERASLTSMKVLFHKFALILICMEPENLSRGHRKSRQRAEPSKQSWNTSAGQSQSIADYGMKYGRKSISHFVWFTLTSVRDFLLSDADTAGVILPSGFLGTTSASVSWCERTFLLLCLQMTHLNIFCIYWWPAASFDVCLRVPWGVLSGPDAEGRVPTVVHSECVDGRRSAERSDTTATSYWSARTATGCSEMLSRTFGETAQY